MAKLALTGLLAVFPIVFVFYLFNSSIALLKLVFAILLSFDPFIYQFKKGSALLFANILGGLRGLIGVLAYNILVIAPSYRLYIILYVVSFLFCNEFILR